MQTSLIEDPLNATCPSTADTYEQEEYTDEFQNKKENWVNNI